MEQPLARVAADRPAALRGQQARQPGERDRRHQGREEPQRLGAGVDVAGEAADDLAADPEVQQAGLRSRRRPVPGQADGRQRQPQRGVEQAQGPGGPALEQAGDQQHRQGERRPHRALDQEGAAEGGAAKRRAAPATLQQQPATRQHAGADQGAEDHVQGRELPQDQQQRLRQQDEDRDRRRLLAQGAARAPVEQQRQQRQGQQGRQPHGEGRGAQHGDGARHQPVDPRGLVRIDLSGLARQQPVAGRDHLPRRLAVAPLVGFGQGAQQGGGGDHRQEQQDQSAVGGGGQGKRFGGRPGTG